MRVIHCVLVFASAAAATNYSSVGGGVATTVNGPHFNCSYVSGSVDTSVNGTIRRVCADCWMNDPRSTLFRCHCLGATLEGDLQDFLKDDIDQHQLQIWPEYVVPNSQKTSVRSRIVLTVIASAASFMIAAVVLCRFGRTLAATPSQINESSCSQLYARVPTDYQIEWVPSILLHMMKLLISASWWQLSQSSVTLGWKTASINIFKTGPLELFLSHILTTTMKTTG